jgi:hypothetical protein
MFTTTPCPLSNNTTSLLDRVHAYGYKIKLLFASFYNSFHLYISIYMYKILDIYASIYNQIHT